MIVDVSFKYRAEIRRARRRTTESMVFMGSAPVEFPEFTAAEAPIALWWRSPRLADVPGQVCVRSIGGELYEPIAPTGFETPGDRLPPSGSEFRKTGRLAKADTPGFVGVSGLLSIARSGKVVAAGGDDDLPDTLPAMAQAEGIAEIVVDHHDKFRSEMRHALAGLCLVDGVVYRKISCPVLRVDNRYSFMRMVAGYAGDRPHEGDAAGTYRIDRFASARAVFVAGVKGMSYPSRDAFDHLRPDIVDASLIHLDEADHVIRAASQRLLDKLSSTRSSYGEAEPVVASCGRAVIAAFGDLRDTLATGGHWHGLVSPLRTLAVSFREGSAMWWESCDAALAVLARLEAEGAIPEGLDVPRQDEEALGMVF